MPLSSYHLDTYSLRSCKLLIITHGLGRPLTWRIYTKINVTKCSYTSKVNFIIKCQLKIIDHIWTDELKVYTYTCTVTNLNLIHWLWFRLNSVYNIDSYLQWKWNKTKGNSSFWRIFFFLWLQHQSVRFVYLNLFHLDTRVLVVVFSWAYTE